MAAIRICSNCGAKNSTENRFCEDCGYDMNMAPAFEKSAEELFCPNGHKVSDSSLGFCTECGEKLVREKPVNAGLAYDGERPAVEKKAPMTALAGIRCPSCGAVNEEGNLFCEECGTPLGKEPEDTSAGYSEKIDEAMPRTAPVEEPKEAPVFKPYRAERTDLPDIPDIMKPLTNRDMKRSI